MKATMKASVIGAAGTIGAALLPVVAEAVINHWENKKTAKKQPQKKR